MPQQAWNDKRERQYEHIKSSQKDRGAGEGRAEEIAARTVNKNRARGGESDRASKTSIKDKSPQQRGGERPATGRAPAGRRRSSSTTTPRSAGSAGGPR